MLRSLAILLVGVALGGIVAAAAPEKSADSVLKPLQDYIGQLVAVKKTLAAETTARKSDLDQQFIDPAESSILSIRTRAEDHLFQQSRAPMWQEPQTFQTNLCCLSPHQIRNPAYLRR